MDVRLKPISEIEAIEPKILTFRIYSDSTRTGESKDLNEWQIPLFPKTTMGYLGGSEYGYVTEVSSYFGTTYYMNVRIMTKDV